MSDLISTARRRELGAELRRLRERLGINGADMAARLEWTPTMVSRVETGKRPVSQFEVLKYTTLCGADSVTQAALMELAIEPDDYRLKRHDGRLPDALKALIFHETTAIAINTYEPTYLPGMLQVREYVHALFLAGGKVDPAVIEERVEARLSRREVLTRIYPPQCEFFVHENALRLPVGGQQVMHEQMLHLLFAGSRPQCCIRVVPTSAGPAGMVAGSFHIFSYREGAPLVYVQNQTTSEFLESKTELRSYQEIVKRVARVALNVAQSREFIARMASDYEQGAAQDGSPGVAQE